MRNSDCIFTFHSTHKALEFEKLLKKMNYEVKLIPVPRQISSSCGLAGRINENRISEIKQICQENNIEFDEIFRVYHSPQKKSIKLNN